MVIPLVWEESCLETSFFESGNDAFPIINGIEILCRNGRKQHWYTLVRSIRFRQNMAERGHSFYFRKFRVRIPIIVVKTPVQGAGCLAHYHNINFAPVFRMGRLGVKSKVLGCAVIRPCLGITLECECYIVTHVGRIQIRLQLVTFIQSISGAQWNKTDEQGNPCLFPFPTDKFRR